MKSDFLKIAYSLLCNTVVILCIVCLFLFNAADMEQRCNALSPSVVGGKAFYKGSCYTAARIDRNQFGTALALCNQLPNGHLGWIYTQEINDYLTANVVRN
jgi:hypothetical protein